MDEMFDIFSDLTFERNDYYNRITLQLASCVNLLISPHTFGNEGYENYEK